jgi:hypothetical protein
MEATPMSALLDSLSTAKPAMRQSSPVRTIVVLFVLGVVVSGAIGFARGFLESKEEQRRVVAEMRDTMSAAKAAVDSKGPVPAPAALAAGASDSAKAGAVFKNMVNRSLTHRRQYERELEAAGWMHILDGARLAKDANLDESRAIVERAKAIVAKYRAGTDELIVAMKREIETLDVGAKTRKSMLEGFERTAPRSRQQAEDMWTLEEQVFGEVEKVVALLGAKKKWWRIEGGEISFTRQAELDAYNAHMARVQSIAARQEQMQRASIETAQQRLDQLAR